MQPEARDPKYLWDMREAAREITDLVSGRTLTEFCEERVVRFAVERLLIILGEAAASVSEKFRLQHDELPWRRIQKVRNALAHGYGSTAAEEVYRTCRDFIMPLALQLQSIVPNPPSDEPHRSL